MTPNRRLQLFLFALAIACACVDYNAVDAMLTYKVGDVLDWCAAAIVGLLCGSVRGGWK